MTFDEHMDAIEQVSRKFNQALLDARADGFRMKTHLSGDGATIYSFDISREVGNLFAESVPPLPT